MHGSTVRVDAFPVCLEAQVLGNAHSLVSLDVAPSMQTVEAAVRSAAAALSIPLEADAHPLHALDVWSHLPGSSDVPRTRVLAAHLAVSLADMGWPMHGHVRLEVRRRAHTSASIATVRAMERTNPTRDVASPEMEAVAAAWIAAAQGGAKPERTPGQWSPVRDNARPPKRGVHAFRVRARLQKKRRRGLSFTFVAVFACGAVTLLTTYSCASCVASVPRVSGANVQDLALSKYVALALNTNSAVLERAYVDGACAGAGRAEQQL